MKRIFSALLLVALLGGSAFGLSDKEYRDMKRDSKLFRDADRKLGIVWNRIESQVTKAAQTMFDTLLEEQREWIRSGRDIAARKYMKQSYYPINAAYAIVTYERIGYLEGWEAFVFGEDD